MKPSTDLLRQFSIFQDLADKDLRLVQKHTGIKDFKKGEIIHAEGDTCSTVFLVSSGRVKVYRTSSAGREQILEVLEKGDTCACNPGAEKWSCSTNAQALSSCQLIFLNRKEYGKLAESNHKFMAQLNKIFSQRLCRFCSLIENVSLNNSCQRLVQFILDMASEKNNSLNEGDVSLSFTQDEIAHRLGLARETVTRHISRLKKEKLIQYKSKNIIVKNRALLEDFLSRC